MRLCVVNFLGGCIAKVPVACVCAQMPDDDYRRALRDALYGNIDRMIRSKDTPPAPKGDVTCK